MRTEQISYFLETVKTGSFTKAAANLHMQQPSLREAIINLENELGCPLFIRTKKGTSLTEYGEYALPYLQNIHDTFLSLKQHTDKQIEKNSLNIEADICYGKMATDIYNALQFKLPDKHCKIHLATDTDTIMTHLRLGHIDIGLITTYSSSSIIYGESTIFKNKNCGFTRYLLAATPIDAVMYYRHPLASKKCLTCKDFYGEFLIFGGHNGPLLKILEQKIDLHNVETLLSNGNYDLLYKYCLEQNGIAFMPHGYNKNPDLVCRPINDFCILKQYVVYPKEQLTNEVMECINAVKMVIATNVSAL